LAVTTEYRVQLDAFEGPLDLLLYLIRRAEVEIIDIPISDLTDQFLSYLGDLDKEHLRIDIDTAGEFLVMAATLMEIKSRMIARASEPEAERDESQADLTAEMDPADPRAELVRQLLEYKKYRDMADGLDARRSWWSKRFPASPAGVDNEQLDAALHDLDQVDLEDVEVVDLVQAFARIIGSVDMTRLGEHEVVTDETPIELHAADIVERLEQAPPGPGTGMTLRAILTGRTRPEMIGLFLALLDLIRQQRVSVRQEDETDEIIIEPQPEPDNE
jgi:segregation and condensation protein A